MNQPWTTDTPFTIEQIDQFNHLTHFPIELTATNQRFVRNRQERHNAALSQLQRYQINSIPPDVQSLLNRLDKAHYEAFIAQIRSRGLAPPWTVTGRANYSKVVTERRQRRSENTQRNALERINQAQEQLRKAIQRYSPHAPISSDEPDAIAKLQTKLESLEKTQALMKAANKIVKSKKLTRDQAQHQLRLLFTAANYSEKSIGRLTVELFQPDFCNRIGFADYQLKNNSAEIRRLRARIADLELKRAESSSEFDIAGVRVVENVEDNRLQIFFPDKPDVAIHKKLKQNGFRWSPTVGAWQRMRSDAAKYAAERILSNFCTEA